MSGVLIHDGRRVGHRKWCLDAILVGAADGVILSPFSTPRAGIPRHPSGKDIADEVLDSGGELLFDAMTHARLLGGVNRTDFYDGWQLWGPDGPVLGTNAQRLEHVERVFARQDELGSPRLGPTQALNSPLSVDAISARELARIARSKDRNSWQSVAGTRAFWSAGPDLDAHIGMLAGLGAPTWVVTVVNDVVLDAVPDLSDIPAFEGLLRSIHSLSLRSRVIVAYADYAGLPAVAAGADSVGSGWDRAQRTFDPDSFRIESDPGIKIPASYVTQGRLHAILRRDTAEAIERWNPGVAAQIRGSATMPASDNVQRLHHLTQLRNAVSAVDSAPSRATRVGILRDRYRIAGTDFSTLQAALRRIVSESDRRSWMERPSEVLESYADSEGY